MNFRTGKFYEFEDLKNGYTQEGKFVCETTYDDGTWAFRPISDDFIRYSHGGFVLREKDKTPPYKEIFQEMKVEQREEMFKFALKIASSGDIDGNLNGMDTGTIQHYEGEYQLFSKLWKVPIAEEKEWLENFGRDTYSVMGIPENMWFEDEELIGDALGKLRVVKQYLAEMKE